MQIVGRLVGGAVAVGAVAFAGTSAMEDNTTRDASGAITESGGLGAYQAQVGDCINFPGDNSASGIVESVEGVPCNEPHEEEMYHQFVSVAGPAWPGDAALETEASEKCFDAFEPYVGRSYQSSDLDFYFWIPTQQGWEAGDRSVNCLAFQMDGLQLTSTIRNSQR